MRTTIRLDAPLLSDAKRFAAETGRTLTAVIEEALRESLARHRHRTSKQRRVALPTFPGGKVQPGVDLDDASALLDLMEGRDALD